MKLIIIDSYNIAFRLFYTGTVNADAFFYQIRMLSNKFSKHRVVLTGDSGRNWRHTLWSEYKQNRTSVPSDFIEVIKQLPHIAHKLGYPWLSIEGWEADDIIFTLVKQHINDEVVVVSSDKDLYQLLEYKNVSIWSQGKFITSGDVVRKFGVRPELIGDLLALMGDASDNIPGVPKIGPKIAADLLNKYGSLANILNALDELPKSKAMDSLRANVGLAEISRELVTLKEVPICLPEYIEADFPSAPLSKVLKEALESGWVAIYQDKEISTESSWAECNIPSILDQLQHVRIIDNSQYEDINIMHHMLYGTLASPKSAYQIAQLWIQMNHDLLQYKCARAYYLADYKLSNTLRAMEKRGAYIDLKVLYDLEVELTQQLGEIEQQIYAIAGQEFLISSPQQLAKVLQSLNISQSNKTDVQTLEEIDHPLIPLILEFRHIKKLLNTYIQPLQISVDDNHRIHTSYTMTVTKTGRLSSISPNLQNIPIKTALGLKLRNAFQASPGKMLVIADYDQMELRLLAHMGPIPSLIKQFQDGQDWHNHVAEVLFGSVTPENRRKSKTVTFGIIYGMTAYGLAQRLHISKSEAEQIRNVYYESFSGMFEYQQKMIAFAQKHGYVQTLWGRRCYVSGPDMHRQAINAPIQGTAAEIIKHRMKFIPNLILQVHDEVVAEVAEGDVDEIVRNMREVMEVNDLLVPLTVKIRSVKKWGDI